MHENIPILNENCTLQLKQAAATMVALKRELDRLTRSVHGERIVARAFPVHSPSQTISPFDFVCIALPFFKRTRPSSGGTRYKALVPAPMVIGESWRWQPDDLNEAEMQKVIDITYSAFASSDPDHARMECPQYCHIEKLGLVFAHEAKNRVALFVKLGIPHIPALVSVEDYPSPERLRLFSINSVDLAVLDGRMVERVRALHVAENLLLHYGVLVEYHWPEDYPSLDRVLDELDRPRFEFSGHEPVADLDKLHFDAQAENTLVHSSLMEIDDVKLPELAKWALLAGITVASFLVLAILPRTPGIAIAAAILFGACLTLLTVPALPLLRTPVHKLREPYRGSYLFELKKQMKQKERDGLTHERERLGAGEL